jgi:hypothetical protein
MERASGGKVTAAFYDEGSSVERYIPGPANWARGTARSLARSFSKDANCDDVLPQHSGLEVKETHVPVKIELPLMPDLLLLACMNERHGGKFLHQDSIGAVGNDQELFYFIRKQLSRSRKEHRLSQLLKKVTSIRFTMVS